MPEDNEMNIYDDSSRLDKDAIDDALKITDELLDLVGKTVDKWAEMRPEELEWTPEREAAMEAMSILSTDMNSPDTRIITMDRTPDNHIAGITIANPKGEILLDEQLRPGIADDGVIYADWEEIKDPQQLPFSLSEKEMRIVETLKDAKGMIFQTHADYELFKQEIENIQYPKEPALPRKILAVAADRGISVARTFGTLALAFSVFAKPSLLGPLTAFIKGIAFGYRRSQARGISHFQQLMGPFRVAMEAKIRERREVEKEMNNILKNEAKVWKDARSSIKEQTKDLYGKSVDIGRFDPSESRLQTARRHSREKAEGYTKHGFPTPNKRETTIQKLFRLTPIYTTTVPRNASGWPRYSKEYGTLPMFDRKVERFLQRMEKLYPTPGKAMRESYGEERLMDLLKRRTQPERVAASEKNKALKADRPVEMRKQSRLRRKACRT